MHNNKHIYNTHMHNIIHYYYFSYYLRTTNT